MDKVKTNVVKSKSSNTTISKENRTQNKKSRSSHAELSSFSLKKRGVYVEKKANKTSMTEVELPKKPKIIPRPDKKRFLNSILTILSKSTTGTQYPELREKTNKMKGRKKKICEENIGDLNNVAQKHKYRSKILNEYVALDQDKVVVLQSKKDIIQTPSNNSQRISKDKVSIKWSDLVHKKESDVTVIDTKANEKHKALMEHIESGKSQPPKITTFIDNNDEPMTLVANEKQKDSKLYDFFVDLLESTFNAYNVKEEPEISKVSSKLLTLEIQNSVLKNLNINTNQNTKCFIEEKPQNEYIHKRVNISDDWDDKLLDDDAHISLRSIDDRLLDEAKPSSLMSVRDIFLDDNNLMYVNLEPPIKLAKRNRKLKSNSFSYQKKQLTTTTRSFIHQNVEPRAKKTPRKDKKKDFLNLLKEQLSIQDEQYEPPKNFFESLQIMAKYKRRCQKSIHFDESTKNVSEASLRDCMFRRRRLLSTPSKSSYRTPVDSNRSLRSFSRKSIAFKPNMSRIELSDNDAESRLSLAVYNYDYTIDNANTCNDNDYKITEYDTYDEKQGKDDDDEPTEYDSESTVFVGVQETDSYTNW